MMIKKWKYRLPALVAALLLGWILPASVRAAQENAFVLVVEYNQQLVVEPEYIPYSEGQDLKEVLDTCRHTIYDLERGNIMLVNGKGGGTYTRTDQNGNHDLSVPAAEVTHFFISERKVSTPAKPLDAGLLKLMTAMADYNAIQEPDVRRAAAEEYAIAKQQFVNKVSGNNASALADNLNNAVQSYRERLDGQKQTLTFTDGSGVYSTGRYPGVRITAENPYGRIWEDKDGDGKLSLPKDTYSFRVEQDGQRFSGTVKVSSSQTVSAQLPTTNYLDLSKLRLSGSYGPDNDDTSVSQFRHGEFTLGTWKDRSVTVSVSDTFAGRVYINAAYTVLTVTPKLSAIYTPAGKTEEQEDPLVFNSLQFGTEKSVLSSNAEGNKVIYRLTWQESGYTYSQDYTVTFDRLPTLRYLSVRNDKGVDQASTIRFDPDVTEYDYKVLDTLTKVTVVADHKGSGYQIRVNGQDASNGVTVPLNGKTDITVTVTGGDYTRTYLLHIQPGAGQKVTLITADRDTTVNMVNKNGVQVPCERDLTVSGKNRYYYTMVLGETYTYVATKKDHYHISEEFELKDASKTIQVSVPTEPWLTDLALGSGDTKGNKGNISLDSSFAKDDHGYTVSLADTQSAVYLWVNGISNAKYEVFYQQITADEETHDITNTISPTPGQGTGVRLTNLLMQNNPHGNTATVRLSRVVGGITQYQDYVLDFKRSLTLKDLDAAYGGQEVPLIRSDGGYGFRTEVKTYEVTVPMAADVLDLSLESYTGSTCYGQEVSGYRVSVNGMDVTEAGAARVDLSGTIDTETVQIQVTNDHKPTLKTEYTLQVLKSTPVNVTFAFDPADAVLNLHEKISQNRIWPDDAGVYQLCEDFDYVYTVTSVGYVGRGGNMKVSRDGNGVLKLYIDDDSWPVKETDGAGAVHVEWTMTAAQPNESLQDLPSEWPDFRGNRENNAVTDVPIPNYAKDGTLYWAVKLGDGIDTGAVGNPILVDGMIVTYAGSTLYQVDPVSGETMKSAPMVGTSSFAITPPAYHEGMIFVALAGGTIQAFDAATLESLWVYHDPLGGQPNCPITFYDGRLYTGFWNQERSKANFVCLTVTDEDPYQTHEEKVSSWYVTHVGGFYWAGACVRDGYVLVGTDDGDLDYVQPTANLLLLDAYTGRQEDIWRGLSGDVRSTVMYDEATDAYYFTSKSGRFYSVRVINGSFADQWHEELVNGKGGVPMSTSTPVVYNGRAYVGVSGVGQFAQYGGHNITVIDLASQRIAYRVDTHGYPQTSGLLTTAYEEETGYVYVYFFDNMTPGKLRVLRDKPGQTRADYLTQEGDHSTAYALFTPTGEQAEYAICSPITDEYGTVYFKNDSGYLMAFGSAVESLTVAREPDKLEYIPGETFDPEGMVITVNYVNGMERQVTSEYLQWSGAPLTAGDPTAGETEFTVVYPYVMYHNKENGNAMDTGVTTTTPTVKLKLIIRTVVLGDVDGDGSVTEADAKKILASEAQNSKEPLPLAVADVTGDGIVDSNDAVLILQVAQGKLNAFPAPQTQKVVAEEEILEEILEN